jgi:hypothetical protein
VDKMLPIQEDVIVVVYSRGKLKKGRGAILVYLKMM